MEISGAEECTHRRREGRRTLTSIAGCVCVCGGGGVATRSGNKKSLLPELSLRGAAGIFPQLLS